jgi:hypothetical protein
VVFSGRMTVKLRYGFVLRDGRVVYETWQVDPALSL